MDMRQAGFLIRSTLAALALALLAGVSSAADAPKQKVVEVVICLDTSNSMDGLIAAAKQKLWDIINDMALAKPAPQLRVAVYSYGNNAYDARNGWVRQEIELTTDLDKVSQKLFALEATKKGGSEEYVARVSKAAVDDLKWSNDPKALKVIFVCGNESATQDPDVTLKSVSEAALKKDIIINTIFCGTNTDNVATGWKDFAVATEGRFVAIDQNRAVVTVATPFDKELVELSGKINTTFVFSGKNARDLKENQKLQDQNADKVGGGVAQARAQAKGGGLYGFGQEDLVERLKQDPKFDVKKVPENELCDEMKKLKPEEREKHVKEMLAKREELQKQIVDLAKKRDAYIATEQKKNPNPGEKAFDEAVRGTLRDQAKKKGIEIPK